MYHVYENSIVGGHRCRVHRYDCSFCNEGRGIRPALGSHHGKWYGPFPTLEEALAFGATISPDTRECRICIRAPKPTTAP